jgi:tRNA threonylcarbamoyladenosine biosynthesis protein TsaE
VAQPEIHIEPCGAEMAMEIHRITQVAFEEHLVLDPPSGAPSETLEGVTAELAQGGGAIAWVDGESVGCLRFRSAHDHLWVRRVSVIPDRRRQGVARALMLWAHEEASRRGLPEVRLGVRRGLEPNERLYRELGYRKVKEQYHEGYDDPTWDEMALSV